MPLKKKCVTKVRKTTTEKGKKGSTWQGCYKEKTEKKTEKPKPKPKPKKLIIKPKVKIDPTKGFKGKPIEVGHGSKATPLSGEFDPVKKMIKVKTSSARYHFGKAWGGEDEAVNKMFPEEATYERGEYTYQRLYPHKGGEDRLIGRGFSVGQLGEGSEDHHGHNIVPALKHQGHKHYSIYEGWGSPATSHITKFIKGYKKGGWSGMTGVRSRW